jgi:hypothetical protein
MIGLSKKILRLPLIALIMGLGSAQWADGMWQELGRSVVEYGAYELLSMSCSLTIKLLTMAQQSYFRRCATRDWLIAVVNERNVTKARQARRNGSSQEDKLFALFMFLVENGVALDQKNVANRTPLYLSLVNHHWKIADLFWDRQSSNFKHDYNAAFGGALLAGLFDVALFLTNPIKFRMPQSMIDWAKEDHHFASTMSPEDRETIRRQVRNNSAYWDRKLWWLVEQVKPKNPKKIPCDVVFEDLGWS